MGMTKWAWPNWNQSKLQIWSNFWPNWHCPFGQTLCMTKLAWPNWMPNLVNNVTKLALDQIGVFEKLIWLNFTRWVDLMTKLDAHSVAFDQIACTRSTWFYTDLFLQIWPNGGPIWSGFVPSVFELEKYWSARSKSNSYKVGYSTYLYINGTVTIKRHGAPKTHQYVLDLIVNVY